jgi:ATP-binding cassette, subfamily C (CFTR/MRP), member 4
VSYDLIFLGFIFKFAIFTSRTDQLIQNTIKTQFAECTVFTIAHRLHTVIDSDRVMVMEAGRLVEFGHAHELLHKEGGVFRSLVEHTGGTAAKLGEIAESSFAKSKTE